MDQEILKAFNDSIGVILTFLDEAEASFTTKSAIKGELWKLCDKKILPITKGLGHGQEENSGNH